MLPLSHEADDMNYKRQSQWRTCDITWHVICIKVQYSILVAGHISLQYNIFKQ